ncbi:hypothetical protein Mp_3g06050 [Marchantia polymorpha subsp. ruderalis]|uniref:Uncharacterized protein n=2 Tax=Marchantia polymorpha TaxID=3197 RepID=A0AAF6AXW6_MARPO|nr:hypothetical protein MARPO_0006s0075 [Marchantia polymorpha]BBN04600.1 hypothetical protein Mp_3g06050 [Marchantia polymorpha subsp. ruderalis]|eukprot:PTQ48036.1 hypothetical protein MARPO_0006s0075 [Marchantia polymorpha]
MTISEEEGSDLLTLVADSTPVCACVIKFVVSSQPQLASWLQQSIDCHEGNLEKNGKNSARALSRSNCVGAQVVVQTLQRSSKKVYGISGHFQQFRHEIPIRHAPLLCSSCSARRRWSVCITTPSTLVHPASTLPHG